jgi:hypothetical protein
MRQLARFSNSRGVVEVPDGLRVALVRAYQRCAGPDVGSFRLGTVEVGIRRVGSVLQLDGGQVDRLGGKPVGASDKPGPCDPNGGFVKLCGELGECYPPPVEGSASSAPFILATCHARIAIRLVVHVHVLLVTRRGLRALQRKAKLLDGYAE